MKRNLLALFVSVLPLALLWAQPSEGYYDEAEGKCGEALRTALYGIIHDHTQLSYKELWSAFYDTDVKPDGTIWDMYSDIPGGTPPYVFYPGDDQCGNYGSEGDCYNREHSFPKSWFNDQYPMYTDLVHLCPTDGYVNSYRSNHPFGEVGSSTTYVSENGSKVGKCVYPGYSGTAFEPIDAYKGDFARIYFYMSTCYRDKRLDYGNGSAMFSGSQLQSWAVNMFLEWHRADPVSQKEIDRNNAVEDWQHNRNPFIDYPELAEHIWGTLQDVPFSADGTVTPPEPDNFQALPATNVTADGFTANWTASPGATGYLLDVYTVQTTGEGVSEVLLESDFMDDLPAGWTKGSGYTAAEDKGYRLASSNNDGAVSTTLDLDGHTATLTVNAMQYNNDNSTLTLTVDGQELEAWTMTADYADYTAELPADASAITLSARKKARVYLASVRVETEGSKQERVSADGYPMLVGDVLSYDVTGLAAEQTYYYTVTPQGNGAAPSNEVEVYTTLTSASVSAEAVDATWQVADGELRVRGLQGEPVQVFTLTGVPLYVAPSASGEVQVALPAPGMYLLRIGTWAGVVAGK